MKLYLDDERGTPEDWVGVMTAPECIAILWKYRSLNGDSMDHTDCQNVTDLSLDHDLGGEEFVNPDSKDCGMEIIRYLEKTGWPKARKVPELFVIHSSNFFAAKLMRESLENFRNSFQANVINNQMLSFYKDLLTLKEH